MNMDSLAPCGVVCDLCLGFQRTKNKCVGCNNEGNKPYHCTVCSIKTCPEKQGNDKMLCSDCPKFPCRRIKSLDKRYIAKYGENLIGNLTQAKETGIGSFISTQKQKWTCPSCGQLLCVHKPECLHCGAKNVHFP